MSGANGFDEFEVLAMNAGIPDVPVECDPMVTADVMVTSERCVTHDQADADPGPTTYACGFGHALADLGGQWRRVLVLSVLDTPEISAAFGTGPGPVFQSQWWSEQLGPGQVLVCCSITTSDDAGVRRFTIAIPALPELVTAIADVEVIALTLVDDDAADELHDDAVVWEHLAWFVANDPDIWVGLDQGPT